MDLVGGRELPRRLRFENLYVKTKESRPLWGACAGYAPSRSANGNCLLFFGGQVILNSHLYRTVMDLFRNSISGHQIWFLQWILDFAQTVLCLCVHVYAHVYMYSMCDMRMFV